MRGQTHSWHHDQKLFILFLSKTNRYHVAVHTFSNKSGKTWKCGMNMIFSKTRLSPQVPLFCSCHIFTSPLIYSWFSITQLNCHVGEPNKSKMLLTLCIIIEPNSQKTFSLLCSTLTWPPMTSGASQGLLNRHTSTWNLF